MLYSVHIYYYNDNITYKKNQMKSTLAIMYFPFLLLKVVFDKYFYFMFMKALPEFTVL